MLATIQLEGGSGDMSHPVALQIIHAGQVGVIGKDDGEPRLDSAGIAHTQIRFGEHVNGRKVPGSGGGIGLCHNFESGETI
jgi:hypothetical protein